MDTGRHLIGTVLQDTYRIERLLGRGGMGAVYEASHLRLPRRFAVKFLSPEVAEHAEALARFRREAEIASGLGHPHILEVIDFNNAPDGTPYILMEFLDGEDLAARIRRRKGLELGETAAILRQASSALHAAHEKGVIHRDLKPQNIFLCRRGERDDYVKVVDFGISKVLGSQSVMTKTHALLGTPCYMSPEQAEQRTAEIDLRTDVYAMGVILFEMLAGAPPFLGDSVPALLYLIVHKQAPSLRAKGVDVPESVEQVIARALCKKREDRFASMRELWQTFEKAIEQAQVEFTEPTEDRQTQWTKPQSVAEEPAPVVPPLHTAPTALPGAALPTIRSTVHAAEAAAPSGVGQSTTLSSSVGEVRQPTQQVAATSSRRAPLIIGGAAVLVLAVAGVLFFGTRGTPEGDGPGDTKLAAKPPALPKPEPPPPVQLKAPVQAAPQVFQIAVTADDPKVVCRVRVDDGPIQTQFVPCKFRARAGQRFSLKAVKRGLNAFTQQWTVEEPRTLALEVLEKARRIVLGGDELPAAKRTLGERKTRGRASGTKKEEQRKVARPPAARAPEVEPPKAARKPEEPKKPPEKPKPRRRRVGEGVLDF